MRLSEFSPDNLAGSFTKDLIFSKMWLINQVGKISKTFNSIYILGSWYGNLSVLLMTDHFKFDKIINVDIDRSSLLSGQKLAKKLGIDNKIEPMVKDVNQLDYRQAQSPSLVINTSVNDIEDRGWFDRIPKGTLVALQTRDDSLDRYKFTKTLYQSKKELEDPEQKYIRVMKIGVK
jgi:hypothetical protein